MLYKAILACFLVASGDALKVGTTGGRREFLAKAAYMVPLMPLSAFAEQKKGANPCPSCAGKLHAQGCPCAACSHHSPGCPCHLCGDCDE
mmetsp:Transcript_2005/g.4282  ORF Transcript_2005/g.4282 Transcript_2005/m.4282 type:complete len:90 (+) Transcript_2005:70-339(+)